jgi:hypothetical protein
VSRKSYFFDADPHGQLSLLIGSGLKTNVVDEGDELGKGGDITGTFSRSVAKAHGLGPCALTRGTIRAVCSSPQKCRGRDDLGREAGVADRLHEAGPCVLSSQVLIHQWLKSGRVELNLRPDGPEAWGSPHRERPKSPPRKYFTRFWTPCKTSHSRAKTGEDAESLSRN